MSKVITANLLATGRVVFLGANGTWVETVGDAIGYIDDATAEDGLAQARRDQDRALIIEPFVTTRGSEHDGRPAMTLRDTIRAFGPTITFQPNNSGRARQGAGNEGI